MCSSASVVKPTFASQSYAPEVINMAKPSMRLFAFSIADASILGSDASNSAIFTA